MNVNGFIKLTLLDYPGKTACTVFFAGCNFRCPFCHNASLVTDTARAERIPAQEVFAYLKKRRGLIDGVCITGGEPLLLPELPDFIEEIHALGYPVKLDTNGSAPDRLRHLVSAGLVDYVAMDIKNSPAKYQETVGVADFDITPVLESVSFLKSGAVACEFRTTLVRELHTAEDVREMASLIAGEVRYFLQSYSDSGDIINPVYHAFSRAELAVLLKTARLFVPGAELRGV